MSAFHNGGSGGVTTSSRPIWRLLRRGAGRDSLRWTVFDTGSIAQAAIIGYWHIVGGTEKFADLSSQSLERSSSISAPGVQFQVLVAFAKCGAAGQCLFLRLTWRV